jgi:ACS family glucarate transporter-like MFS transporter
MNRTSSNHEKAIMGDGEASPFSHWWLVGCLAAFSMTSYLVRANISIASETMGTELGLNHVQMGEVFSSFLAGYALFQIAGGAIGDRFGPRLTLGISALLWSLTTVLTGLMPRFFAARTEFLLIALFAVRFLLGASEATTFPVGNLAVRLLLRPAQHATGTSVMFLGTCIASSATGPLVSYLALNFGWQSAFYLTAIPPFVLGVVWLVLAPRDRPRESSEPRRRRLQRREVTAILFRRNVVLLIVSYISEGYVLFLFVFWMYTYLVERRGFSLINAGWLSAAPWLTALVLTPAGGFVCDRLSQRSKEYGARVVVCVGYLTSGMLLYVAAYAHYRWLCLVGLSISIGSLMAAESGFWSYAAHVAGDHVGLVSGVMNTFGILGGIASTSLVPILVRLFGWGPALASATGMAFLCAGLWLFIRSQDTGDESHAPVRIGAEDLPNID